MPLPEAMVATNAGFRLRAAHSVVGWLSRPGMREGVARQKGTRSRCQRTGVAFLRGI